MRDMDALEEQVIDILKPHGHVTDRTHGRVRDAIRTLEEPLPAELLAKALAALPTTVTLRYFDYREELSDEQLQQIIDGHANDLDNDIIDYNADNDYDTMLEVLKEVLPDSTERDILSDSEDEWGEFQQAVWDRDDSGSPVDALLKLTGDKLFRYSLELTIDETDTPRHDVFDALGDGVPRTPKNVSEVNEMVANASYGGQLYVIFYGSAFDVLNPLMQREYGNIDIDTELNITFTNPHLVLLDKMNGSGMDCAIEGTITKPFHTENVELDGKARGNGYTWDQTAGVYYPAYKCDFTISEPKEVS